MFTFSIIISFSTLKNSQFEYEQEIFRYDLRNAYKNMKITDREFHIFLRTIGLKEIFVPIFLFF